MATAHTFLANDEDLPLILNWLKDAGAVPVAHGLDVTDFGATGHELVLYFPAIGQVNFHADPANMSEYQENSSNWLQALWTRIKQEEQPGRKFVDTNKTPAAGLRLPALKDDKYWVSGELWFPTINLRKIFPELGKICGRFERWIRKYPCVFDNRNGKYNGEFVGQIAQAEIVKCINALPSAYQLLQNGHHMRDYMVNDKSFERWKDRWKSEEDANSLTKP
ncbi:MAG: hypothetical protein ABL952_09195 [Pyrinomonadaceae bacterium]